MVFEEEPPDWGSVQTLPNWHWVGGWENKTRAAPRGAAGSAAARGCCASETGVAFGTSAGVGQLRSHRHDCINADGSPIAKEALTCIHHAH